MKSINNDRKLVSFRITKNLYEQLQDKADEKGVSVNALVLEILQEGDNRNILVRLEALEKKFA